MSSKTLRIAVVAACLLAALTESAAQGMTQAERRTRLNNKLAERFFKTKYDTAYVVRPNAKLTLKLRLNQTGNDFHAKGTVNDVDAKADLKTSHKTTVSIGASYYGISAALALNPGKMSGAYKDYEFNLNYYSSSICIDLSYQRSGSLAGDIRRNELSSRLEQGDLTMKVTNLTATYTFSHSRFSYPAAFNQSYIQRRSAGSWLAGVSYQGGTIKTTDELKARRPDAPEATISVGHFGIGGGYGYNWVPSRRWLLHFSMLPTVVVYNHNKLTLKGERKNAQQMRLNMIFNERVAIVHNFTERYFAGATLVMNNSVFDDNAVIVNQNKWRARLFVGCRF